MFGTANALTLGPVDAKWTSVVGGGDTVTGVGTNQIRWGTPASGSGKSGLGFVGSTGDTFGISDYFSLGSITHYNFTIFTGTSISSANLSLGLTFSDPADLQSIFNFNFTVYETPNNASPATNPLNNDLVYFPSALPMESFLMNGVDYTLKLIGFGDSVGNLISQFSTVETLANTTQLWAQITPVAVPEPATMAVLGITLVGILGISRRRR